MNKADTRFNAVGLVFFTFWLGYFARAEFAAFPSEWQWGLWLIAVVSHLCMTMVFLIPLLRAKADDYLVK